MRSSVEIYTLATGTSRVVWQTEQLVEAPNCVLSLMTIVVPSGEMP